MEGNFRSEYVSFVTWNMIFRRSTGATAVLARIPAKPPHTMFDRFFRHPEDDDDVDDDEEVELSFLSDGSEEVRCD